MTKSLAVFGSTGSVGKNTMDVVKRFKDNYEVIALSCGNNVELLAQQCQEFAPRLAVVLREDDAKQLKSLLAGQKLEVVWGEEGFLQMARSGADLAVCAISGGAGLRTAFESVKSGSDIALANKESLVMAGELFMAEARRRWVKIIPVDSEHSAIFQSIIGHDQRQIKRLLLTASGGPFLNYPLEKFPEITVEMALSHPVWSMGKKISIDSATLMNKGLEVIEAHYLFEVEPERIDIVIHPQGIIHSMVEYWDGALISQMGSPDMRTPIAYALGFPERLEMSVTRFDFSQPVSMTLIPLDYKRFKAPQLAFQSLKEGKSAPIAFNAANEVAVAAFLRRQLAFHKIVEVVEKVLNSIPHQKVESIEQVFVLDKNYKKVAEEIVMGERL